MDALITAAARALAAGDATWPWPPAGHSPAGPATMLLHRSPAPTPSRRATPR